VGVVLDVSDEAKAFLAEAGFDPVFGARPLKRATQRALQDPLAMLLLDEEIAEGTTIHVRVREDGSALEFDVVPPAQLAPVDHAIGVEA
jgi:ATP-dependent Clp protease ATP-binding subunit ClpB